MGALETTADFEAYRSAPVGKALVGTSWVAWCAEATLWGFTLWGTPGRDETTKLVQALQVELEPGGLSHQSIVDTRHLERAEAAAFEVLEQYVREHRAALARRVTKLALLRPPGMTGAVVAGFYSVLDAPYPVGVFDRPDEAIAFLGRGGGGDVFDAMDAIVSAARGMDPIVARLRAHLLDRLQDADVRIAASAMGVSERTLQRRLKDAGTTFAKELTAVRIQEAQRRMRDERAALTAVAYEVGFSSLQHLSTQFKAITGLTPSEWRKQQGG